MKAFFTGIISVVVIVIGIGLFLSGSQAMERVRRFDALRIQHLVTIQSEIINFWQAKGRLPVQLDELKDATRGVLLPQDPQSGALYQYNKIGEQKFTLCATFGTTSKEQTIGMAKYERPYPAGAYPAGPFMDGQNWEHTAGRVCFERTIDPDFFAVRGGKPPKPPYPIQ